MRSWELKVTAIEVDEQVAVEVSGYEIVTTTVLVEPDPEKRLYPRAIAAALRATADQIDSVGIDDEPF